MSYTFDFAISFSRESRPQAKKLKNFLVDRGARVFYDDSYLPHLLGKRLDDELGWVFSSATRYFVPFVSAEYTRRSWPQYEWSIGKLEAEKREEEFILPLRVDDSLLVGLFDTISYVDLRQVSLKEVADILMRKLQQSSGLNDTADGEENWIVTFGLKMEEITREVLPECAPMETYLLCDWLIDDLITRLENAGLKDAQVIEDFRTGETLSVRLCFAWEQATHALEFGNVDCWELLEFAPIKDVYNNLKD